MAKPKTIAERLELVEKENEQIKNAVMTCLPALVKENLIFKEAFSVLESTYDSINLAIITKLGLDPTEIFKVAEELRDLQKNDILKNESAES